MNDVENNIENDLENYEETLSESIDSSEKGKSRKRPPRRKLSPIRIAILVVCAGLFIFCSVRLISILTSYKEGDENVESVAELNSEPTRKVTITNPDEQSLTIPLKEINFDKLSEINSDFKAWIQGPDTVIDYAIVQGDDNDKYLNRQFDNTKNRYGCPFMDYRNADDFTDNATIIYGHYMKNGSMFTSISKYKDQEYYESHKYLILYTPSQTYLLEPYASDVIDGSYFSPNDYDDKEDYQKFIEKMISNSDFKSDINMTADEKTVILYTCAYEYETSRCIVCCRLTPIDEAILKAE